MGRDNGAPFQRGATGYGGSAIDPANLKFAELLGQIKEFEDINWNDYSAKGQNSAHLVVCMVCRNTSGGALTPGQAVEIDPANNWCAYRTAQTVNGSFVIVDEFLPAAGVPNNDVFWAVIDGPTLPVITPGNSADAAAGSYLGADATAKGTLVPQTLGATSGPNAFDCSVNNGWLMAVCAKSAGTRQARYYMRSKYAD